MSKLNIDNILSAQMGEVGGTLHVEFKRTVNTRQYESEVTSVSSSVTLEKPISGAMRMFLTGLMLAQAEYSVMCELLYKRQMSDDEFVTRRGQLLEEVEASVTTVQRVEGRPVQEILDELEIHMNLGETFGQVGQMAEQAGQGQAEQAKPAIPAAQVPAGQTPGFTGQQVQESPIGVVPGMPGEGVSFN